MPSVTLPLVSPGLDDGALSGTRHSDSLLYSQRVLLFDLYNNARRKVDEISLDI